MRDSPKPQISTKGKKTILPGQLEVATNEINIESPTPETQSVCLSESHTHQENPGKPLGPGEYPDFDELIPTAEVPHEDRGDEMVDSGGTQETQLPQASQTPSHGAELLHSRDFAMNRTLEEELQYTNRFMIVLAELDSERPRLGSSEVKASEELIGNKDPDTLWDKCAPND